MSITSQPSQRLVHDHEELDTSLKRLQQSFNDFDLKTIHAKLDLFWARLAVHIRAEHLHLFPAILSQLGKTSDKAAQPSLSEGQSAIDRLRADHDFFMTELARAIAILRDSIKAKNSGVIKLRINTVREVIVAVSECLTTHNEIEESQIYRWANSILAEREQEELLARINQELAKRPSRFSLDTWSQS